jgi:hypothetical protein
MDESQDYGDTRTTSAFAKPAAANAGASKFLTGASNRLDFLLDDGDDDDVFKPQTIEPKAPPPKKVDASRE